MPPGHRRVAVACSALALAMLGTAFAAVPLYDLFCRVTGFGGTTRVATEAPTARGSRQIKVRFDSNVAAGVDWQFRPEVTEVAMVPGETRTVYYTLRNAAAQDSRAIASYNVTPPLAGAYFNKIQCFCFTEQTLRAGESREEAVVFFIDPAIERDPGVQHIHTITLSYTFFPVKTPARSEAALPSAGNGRF